MKHLLTCGALALAAAVPATAQVGGAAVIFLQIEPDSRAAGMGNTGVAMADNANAIFWNPANLAGQRGAEFGFTHSEWLPELDAGLSYEYAVGKYNVPKLGTFGAHLTYLNLGKHTWTDNDGQELGEFKSYDLSTGLSFGRQITRGLSAGVGVRYIYSNLAPGVTVDGQETQAGTALAGDLGLHYETKPFKLGKINTTFRAGANIANFGPTIRYSNGGATADGGDVGDPIPTNLRFGWATTFNFDEYNSLTIANDFNKALYRVDVPRNDSGRVVGARQVDSPFKALFSSWKPLLVDLNVGDGEYNPVSVSALEQLTIGVGAEYWYNHLFAMRGGYFYENPNNGNRQFMTFGAGLRYNIVGVDFSYIYAVQEDSPLANTLRLSLLVNFLK